MVGLEWLRFSCGDFWGCRCVPLCSFATLNPRSIFSATSASASASNVSDAGQSEINYAITSTSTSLNVVFDGDVVGIATGYGYWSGSWAVADAADSASGTKSNWYFVETVTVFKIDDGKRFWGTSYASCMPYSNYYFTYIVTSRNWNSVYNNYWMATLRPMISRK